MPRTELIWEGKYDANGKRVHPFNAPLPFQTVETVNEAAPVRRSLISALEKEKPWRNRLIWGDKKYVLPSLLAEFAGKVNLIYIDPPFDTGADFSFTAAVPGPPDDEDDATSFTKLPSVIEQKAYRDTWGRGIDSYLQWFYETLALLHELLAEGGTIYVHLDHHVGHYAKCVMDEVFGVEHFQNEIVWKRTTAHSNAKQGEVVFGGVHDVLLYYSKGPDRVFNVQTQPYDQEYIESHYRHVEPGTNRRYRKGDLTAAKKGGDTLYEWKGVRPYPGRYWAYSKDKMEEFERQGRLVYTSSGMPEYKRYLDEMPGRPVQDLWDDVSGINSQAIERTGYPTQKPEALLDRIIRASSNEGDLVLDCFTGSGTTAAVAEKLGRRWIAADLGRFAIHTTRKRLLALPNVKPFVVQNLGKYERQLWQTGQFAAHGPETSEQADQRHRAYVEFMLGLYHAQPVHGYTWLHGKKGERLVHVGGVDGPVTMADITNISAEFKKAVGTRNGAPITNGIDVLGWDFAFELHEVAKQLAEAANINLKFKRIPRDVMDKRATEQGDIHFFEMAALGVAPKTKGLAVTLELTDFVIPPDDVPEDVRQKVKHWSQWIDFWAVDWNHSGDTFHNEWQAFRTKKEPKLPLSTAHTYPEPGEYKVMVKVIDILGNDTTKTVPVIVKAVQRNGTKKESGRNAQHV